MSKVNINFKLYGILSNYMRGENSLSLAVPASMERPQLIEHMHEELVQCNKNLSPEKAQELMKLLESSAFAKDDEVLDKKIRLNENDSIDVLPPVCGG